MVRQSLTVKALIIVIVIGITGYSYADEVKLGEHLKNEPQRLKVPEFRVPLKSPLKLTGISHIVSAFSTETDSSDNKAFATDSNYALLLNSPDIRKARIENLYETHGFNRVVERRLYYYSKKFKEGFLKHLARAGRYLEPMAKVFKEKNLPVELVFLPLIESGFRLHAYSPKRAAGPWQFIPATAQKYGLKIDWWVDERRDPIKSTIAAANYLSDLYKIFGSWNLALAAYNAGEGRILRAVKRAKSDDFWVLRRTKLIKKETKNYVPSYIAAAAIALDPTSFGLENVDYNNPLRYDEVTIDSPIDLEAVAKFTGADVDEIKELNPELRRWCSPPNVSSYTLKIPVGTKKMFLSNLSNAKDEPPFYVEFYTVKSGDTVGKIARQFGVATRAIIEVNSLDRRALIISGSQLLIPSKGNTAGTSEKKRTSDAIRPVLESRPVKKSRSKTSI